ncbi:hypothetical protein HOLleu_43313 [Holothuria leucospilota]|uniref:Uncharacterized protein n=1 Tax=Holothuria leucospilota TaxID=206669 RepID=A0A9Q1B929_HOLLE|nr:hypothetical protein HOLleu_43313 [Holothuria leucospilota]
MNRVFSFLIGLADQQYQAYVDALSTIRGWYSAKFSRREEENKASNSKAWYRLYQLTGWNEKTWDKIQEELEQMYRSNQIYITSLHAMFQDMGFTDKSATAIVHAISKSNKTISPETIDVLVKLWEDYKLLREFDDFISFPVQNNKVKQTREKEILTRFQLLVFSEFVPLEANTVKLENAMMDTLVLLEENNRANDLMTACRVQPMVEEEPVHESKALLEPNKLQSDQQPSLDHPTLIVC